MTLNAFLLYAITGPGVGAILSVAFELVPYLARVMATLSYDARRLLLLGLCLGVPLAAFGALVWLGDATSTPDAWFAALSAGFAGYATSQVTHLATRKRMT